MALVTWEEKFSALSARMARLELEIARVARYAESSERLSDNVHHRQGELLKSIRLQLDRLTGGSPE
jgi:hypothetical protein